MVDLGSPVHGMGGCIHAIFGEIIPYGCMSLCPACKDIGDMVLSSTFIKVSLVRHSNLGATWQFCP